jgi:hypothetical protein
MKFLIVALTLLSSSAFAAGNGKLLEVHRNAGFVHPDWAFSSDCTVGAEHTFIQNKFGKKDRQPESHYEPTRFTSELADAAAVTAALRQAALGILIDEQGPVDGPTDRYTGIVEGDVVDQHVKLQLRSTSGNNHRNKSPVVPALVELADLNCPYPTR